MNQALKKSALLKYYSPLNISVQPRPLTFQVNILTRWLAVSATDKAVQAQPTSTEREMADILSDAG